MNRIFGALPFVLTLLLFALAEGCRPLDEIDPNPAKGLRFSDDTIFFDTVFTTQRLATRRLRIYNDNPKAIEIETAGFKNPNSPFTVYVNGQAAPASGVRIEGKDSAYVLIQGKLPESGSDTALFVEDELQITVKGLPAVSTPVIAFGQDAIYYDGVEVCNEVWTPQKPIVIFNSIYVPPTCTLTIQAGTRVFSYRNSNILVRGTLIVEGTPERRVVFSGTRLEPEYALVPEQWGAIVILDSSTGSRIDWAVIQNGLRGVQVRIPTERTAGAELTISNTLIRNMSDVGIYGFNAFIRGYNNVIADCGTSGIAGLMGGRYVFWHNTVAYSGNTPFSRRTPTVVFADNYKDEATNTLYTAPLDMNLVNNVFTGSNQEEFLIGDRAGQDPISMDKILNNVVSSYGRKWTTNGNKSISGQLRFHRPLSYDFHPDSLSKDNVAKRAGLNRDQFPERDVFPSEWDALRFDLYRQPRPVDTATIGAIQAFQK